MAELKITHTMNYMGSIVINDQQVKTLSQAFNNSGFMEGPTGEFIVNKELYYDNIKDCREQEDLFKEEMRKIEDESIKE